jgi:hypothetical protein
MNDLVAFKLLDAVAANLAIGHEEKVVKGLRGRAKAPWIGVPRRASPPAIPDHVMSMTRRHSQELRQAGRNKEQGTRQHQTEKQRTGASNALHCIALHYIT